MPLFKDITKIGKMFYAKRFCEVLLLFTKLRRNFLKIQKQIPFIFPRHPQKTTAPGQVKKAKKNRPERLALVQEGP